MVTKNALPITTSGLKTDLTTCPYTDTSYPTPLPTTVTQEKCKGLNQRQKQQV